MPTNATLFRRKFAVYCKPGQWGVFLMFRNERMSQSHGCDGTIFWFVLQNTSLYFVHRQLLLGFVILRCSNKLHPCNDAISALPPAASGILASRDTCASYTSSMAVERLLLAKKYKFILPPIHRFWESVVTQSLFHLTRLLAL